jgi:hypothetical protein
MSVHSRRALYTLVGLALFLLGGPATASAQFRPRPLQDPATGERYHVEAAAGFWFPSADITVSSEGLGIPGSNVDLKQDLGLSDSRLPELHLVLRPGRAHKFRFQYIPVSYEQSAVLTREIVFNGQRYRVGLPVSSTFDWKAYRFGYEFDFISTDRAYGGVVLDLKYTDVTATILTPLAAAEFTREQVPIPAIGGIFRVYPVPNVSITGEITGSKLPANLIKNAQGHYLDVDFYGTLNFTNNIGVQLGYRAFDVGYIFSDGSGTFNLRGLYFGVVARY